MKRLLVARALRIRRASCWLGLLVCLVASLSASRVRAADDDIQLWLEADLRAKVHKRIELQWDQHLRFENDVRTASRWLNDFGLEVKVTKWLDVRAGYRLVYRADQEGADRCCRHRIEGDATAHEKLGKVEVDARFRLQSLFVGDDEPRNVIRLRLGAELRLWKKIRPYLSVEGFSRILEPGPPAADKLRVTLGSKFRVRRPGRLSAFYRFEVAHQDSPHLTHIFGIGGTYYAHKQRPKKKKKKKAEEPGELDAEPSSDAAVPETDSASDVNDSLEDDDML